MPSKHHSQNRLSIDLRSLSASNLFQIREQRRQTQGGLVVVRIMHPCRFCEKEVQRTEKRIEYNVDDITKIEPSMGSQGKAWVFNVMSGESDDDDDDEIVYVVFYISFEYCENFNSRFEHSDTR